MHCCNRLVKTPTRCGEHFAKLLVWWRKGAALPVDWLVESGSASCAARFGSIPHGRGRGHSRGCICAPHAYLCSPLSTIRCVCAHVRSQAAAAAAVEQYRRASTARRCGLLLYAGLHRAQRSGASGAAAYERSAAILMGSCGTAVATVATACSAWLPRPAEHRFFASGGDRALGTDASSVGGS